MVENKAVHLHQNIPVGYYRQGIKKNIFQKIWHSLRFKAVDDFILPVDDAVLDIGCADGTFSAVILQKTKAKKLVGVDVVDHLIEDNKKYFGSTPAMEFFLADAHKLPFAKASFDAVFALEVLEHVEDPRKVISEIKRVLSPGGYIVIMVPRETLLFRLEWWLFRTFGPAKIWNDTHIQQYSGDKLVKLMEERGFRITKRKLFNLGSLEIVQARPR